MSQKYLDKAGLQVVWDKTKEKIAEVKEELNTKVDEIQDLTDEELLAILSDPVLITFRLNETNEFQCEEGMTWAEFIDSEYNILSPFFPDANVLTFRRIDDGTDVNKVFINIYDMYVCSDKEKQNQVTVNDVIVVGDYYW